MIIKFIRILNYVTPTLFNHWKRQFRFFDISFRTIDRFRARLYVSAAICEHRQYNTCTRHCGIILQSICRLFLTRKKKCINIFHEVINIYPRRSTRTQRLCAFSVNRKNAILKGSRLLPVLKWSMISMLSCARDKEKVGSLFIYKRE